MLYIIYYICILIYILTLWLHLIDILEDVQLMLT